MGKIFLGRRFGSRVTIIPPLHLACTTKAPLPQMASSLLSYTLSAPPWLKKTMHNILIMRSPFGPQSRNSMSSPIVWYRPLAFPSTNNTHPTDVLSNLPVMFNSSVVKWSACKRKT